MKLTADILNLYMGCLMYRGGVPDGILIGMRYDGKDSNAQTVVLEYADGDEFTFSKSEISHKPYLRSLSKITDAECVDFNDRFQYFSEGTSERYIKDRLHVIKNRIWETKGSSPEKVLWLLNKQFDLFDLIKNNVAFEKDNG